MSFGTFANAAARNAHAVGPFDIGQQWKQLDTGEIHRATRQGTGAQCWEFLYLDSSDEGAGGAHSALTGLGADDHAQYSLVDGSRAFTGTVAGVTPTLDAHLATKEYVDDLIAAVPAAYTDEQARDAVAAALINSDTIEFNHFDISNQIQANVLNDSILFAKMQEIATDRLIGRDTAGSGNPEEISVGGGIEFSGSQGIRRSALTGDVTASAGSNATTIANDAVTFAKMANLATDRLIGRDTAGTGDPEALTVGGGLEFTGSGGIQRSLITGDVLVTAGSGTSLIADEAVTNTKLAHMAQSTIKGRAVGAGTGDATDLTRAQAYDVVHGHQTLDASTSTVTYNVQNGLYASVTLSSGVSATFDLDFTNLVAGMRGTLQITTSGTTNLNNIDVDGVSGAFTEGGAAPSSFLNDNETAILEWFYDGDLYVWIDAATMVNYSA